MQVTGLSELIRDLDALAAIPDEVVCSMLEAGADVLAKKQRTKANSELQGPYNLGAVAASIKRGKAKRTGGDATCRITFEGSQHGNRMAEIAFVNEYGTQSQEARSFIRTANEEGADEAAAAEQKVLDKYMQSKGL